VFRPDESGYPETDKFLPFNWKQNAGVLSLDYYELPQAFKDTMPANFGIELQDGKVILPPGNLIYWKYSDTVD
jgi:hypothetical protein